MTSPQRNSLRFNGMAFGATPRPVAAGATTDVLPSSLVAAPASISGPRSPGLRLTSSKPPPPLPFTPIASMPKSISV